MKKDVITDSQIRYLFQDEKFAHCLNRKKLAA